MRNIYYELKSFSNLCRYNKRICRDIQQKTFIKKKKKLSINYWLISFKLT